MANSIDPNAVHWDGAVDPKTVQWDAPPTTAGDLVKGDADAAVSGLSHAVFAAPESMSRLVARAVGADPDAVSQFFNKHILYHTQTPIGNEVAGQFQNAVKGVTQPLGNMVDAAESHLPAGVNNVLNQAGGTAMDVAGALPAVGALGAGARAISEAGGAAGAIARTPEEVRAAAGYTGLNSRSDLQQPGAQAVTNTLIGRENNIQPGQPLNAASLTNARNVGPARVYNQAESSVPPQMTQDAPLQAALRNLQDGTSQLPRSPDVDALQQSMLGQPNMTSSELFSNIRAARDRASRYMGSDDPDKQALGQAYNGVAGAYEDFAGRNLPPGMLPQFQDARTAFAKNYMAQAALKGGENIDPAVYGRAVAGDPGLLSGNGAVVGHVYNNLPQSKASIVPGVLSHTAGMVGGGAAGALLGGGAEGAITGSVAGNLLASGAPPLLKRFATRGDLGAAEQAGTNPALSYFGRDTAQAPPQAAPPSAGNLTLAPDGAPPRAAQPKADFDLGDVLSTGVGEGKPDLGLSLAPDAGRQPLGLDFAHDVDTRRAGDLSLAPESATPSQPRYGDLGAVMSQGVPEGMVARSTQPPQPAPGGPTVTQNAQQAPVPGRNILPGSTVISRGGDPTTAQPPSSYIALTPQDDGSMHITSAFVDPASRGQGLGQQQIVDAAQHAEAQGVPLHSDTTVSASQLRAYQAAQSKGAIDFDYADPGVQKAVENVLSGKTKGNSIVSGKGSPVLTNIRVPDNSGDLGSALTGS